MKAYQEAYLKNLLQVVALTDLSAGVPEDIRLFIEERGSRKEKIRALVEENTVLLRENLFPELDDIATADEASVAMLGEFAERLHSGAEQLDVVLGYMIHNALLSYARRWKKRDMLIRELYQMGLSLFYMQNLIQQSRRRIYYWKMGLLFGEAASYIRQYDEIEDVQTRGYIHRSMANLALAYDWSSDEEAMRKLKAMRTSMRALTDPVYREKTPDLPWDTFLYKSHQEFTTAISYLHTGRGDARLVREVMESAAYVWERQLENSRRKGTKPHIRWQMEYEMAQYYCGILTLSELLRRMEEAYMERDPESYSEAGLFHNVFLVALYAGYASHEESVLNKKEQVLSYMYRMLVRYVRSAPVTQLDSSLTRHLIAVVMNFVEYPDGISLKDFLMRLVTCRAPDNYVFFRMTGEVAARIMRRAVRLAPEALLGLPGCDSPQQVREREEELVAFAYEDGLLHDVGSLMFTQMTAHYARSWTEEEYRMYSSHVYIGKRILARCASTAPHAQTAFGHHRGYDGSTGYPEEYARQDNENQAVTDIVSVAAYLNRLVDDASPFQRISLTLDEAIDRVNREAGKTLSPVFARLLPGMRQELGDYFADGRGKAYEQAFAMLKGEQDAAGAGGRADAVF